MERVLAFHPGAVKMHDSYQLLMNLLLISFSRVIFE